MNTAPSSAATNASGWKWPAPSASAVPTSTGATAAGSVRTRAAITQMRTALTLGPLGEAREVRPALLAVCVPSLLDLLAAVEQEVGVMGQLLNPGQSVLRRIEARLQQSQREGGEGKHLPAPLDGLLLQSFERNDGVDHSHRAGLFG